MSKKRRAPGTGGVSKTASGRYLARLPDKTSLGVFDTTEEANAILDAAVLALAEHNVPLVGGITFRGWFGTFLDELEKSRGYHGLSTARSIARVWLPQAPFIDFPLRSITQRHIEKWVTDLVKLPIDEVSDSYIEQILGLLRKAFKAAMAAGLLEKNPVRYRSEMDLQKRPAPTEDPWTHLDPDEQQRMIHAPPEVAHQCMVEFALLTGVRSGEQFLLHDRDVHLDVDNPHIIIRFGAVDRGVWRAPKGRQIRKVHLLPGAIKLLRRWFEIRDEWCAPNVNVRGLANFGRSLVFPGRRGGRLSSDTFSSPPKKGVPSPWQRWLATARIGRDVRWHDLRHTHAASLISGWFGRRWSLEEIREVLGHSRLEETQRYAHLDPSALQRTAAETPLSTAQTISRRRILKIPEDPNSYASYGVSDGN